jgi:hypothetical protein
MILDQLQEEQGWFFLQIKMSLKFFLTKFGKIGISGYYRLLSNSQHLFLGRTNRQFFKSSFKEGFYRSSLTNDEVKIVMVLKCENLNNMERYKRELAIRVKKLLYANIEVGGLDELPPEDKMLLSSNYGIQQYQRILETYTKKIISSRKKYV